MSTVKHVKRGSALRGRFMALAMMMFVLVLMADQFSKHWILYDYHLPDKGSVAIMPLLNFTMVWNHAVTFGMFGGIGNMGRVVFSVVAVAIVFGLGWWVTRTTRRPVAMALGAIAGGAIGNVTDRLRYGAVVDFIHAHAFGWSWYVFNVADAAIVCGVGVLLVDNMFDRRDEKKPA